MRWVLLALALTGCFHAGPSGTVPPPPPDGADLDALRLRFDPLVAGLSDPVAVVADGDRLLVAEQAGTVRVVRGGNLSEPILDLRSRVLSGGERGLLGLALEPGGRRLYLDYTRSEDGASVLARHNRTAEGGLEPAGEVLLTVAQPYANHNGGGLAFGPDGMLYFGLGDGGSGGDPHGHGQRLDSLLGKLLRLDVRPGSGYAVPADNPFVATPGARGEIWALGLRNPWRFSFDRETGALYLGDVGQNRWEEIDYAPPNASRGVNYGWALWEGSERFRPGEARPPLVLPVAEYAHEAGRCSVTGGHVWRAPDEPRLAGVYLYGDYCTGEVWGLTSSQESWRNRVVGEAGARISSFGEDARGAVLLVDHGGRLLRVGVA